TQYVDELKSNGYRQTPVVARRVCHHFLASVQTCSETKKGIAENVWPNVLKFDSLAQRFEWLFDNDFLERSFIEKYRYVDITGEYDNMVANEAIYEWLH
ncbi:hypothetical protein BMS81_08280, partial [Leuconostoc pseudomesenteroides]